VELEIIMLSEVRQAHKTTIIFFLSYFLFVEARGKIKAHEGKGRTTRKVGEGKKEEGEENMKE
jgi:hypothetical protein